MMMLMAAGKFLTETTQFGYDKLNFACDESCSIDSRLGVVG